MIRFLIMLVFIPLIVVIAIFAFRNAQIIHIDLFIAEFRVPLAVVILIALLLGTAFGFVANFFVLLAQKNKIRQLNKQRQTLNSLSEVLKSDK